MLLGTQTGTERELECWGGMTVICKSVLYRYKIKGVKLLCAYLGATPLINMEDSRQSCTPSYPRCYLQASGSLSRSTQLYPGGESHQ